MEAAPVGLVADIGRVSVRFGLTGGGDRGPPREVRTFHTADHPTFTNALIAYLDGVALRNAALPSVLAVAGAARGDLINLTGSRWYISLSGVEAVLRCRPRAINEAAANALALTTLSAGDFVKLPGPPLRRVEAGGSYLLVAPGTGLGVAALLSDGGRLVPMQSEAGHMALAPGTDAERRFARHLEARGGAIEAEMLLSAPGLVNAFRAMGGTGDVTPEEVTRSAGRHPAAVEAMNLFVEYLGSFIGDLVLAFGAWDGVFLTGPIARACHARLADPRFRRRMEAKAAFRRQLGDVPVAVVSRPDLELVGAAAALHDRG